MGLQRGPVPGGCLLWAVPPRQKWAGSKPDPPLWAFPAPPSDLRGDWGAHPSGWGGCACLPGLGSVLASIAPTSPCHSPYPPPSGPSPHPSAVGPWSLKLGQECVLWGAFPRLAPFGKGAPGSVSHPACPCTPAAEECFCCAGGLRLDVVRWESKEAVGGWRKGLSSPGVGGAGAPRKQGLPSRSGSSVLLRRAAFPLLRAPSLDNPWPVGKQPLLPCLHPPRTEAN